MREKGGLYRGFLILSIIVVAHAPSAADAARAAVLPLKHEMTAGRVAAIAIGGALRRALQGRQLTTVDDAVVRRLQDVIPDNCSSRKCMNRIAELVDAQLLVGGRLQRDPDGDAWILQLWLYDRRPQSTDASQQVATMQERCNDCQLAKLSRFSEQLLMRLLDKVTAIGDSAQLTVRSIPKGAVVRIDGAPMGVTDMTFGVRPGPHLVTLHKAGFRVSSHRLQLQQRDRREITSTLVRASGSRRSPPRAYRWLKWTLTGTAVVALGVGIGLWAKGRVSSASEPGVEPEITNFRTPGIVLTAVGGALAGGAVALFILDQPTPSRQRVTIRRSPVAILTGDSALVGYQGSF